MSNSYKLDKTGNEIDNILENAAMTNVAHFWNDLQTFDSLKANNIKTNILRVNPLDDNNDTIYGYGSISYYQGENTLALDFPLVGGIIATENYVRTKTDDKVTNLELETAIEEAKESLKTITDVITDADNCQFSNYQVLLPLSNFKKDDVFVDGFYMFTYSYAQAFVLLTGDMIENEGHIPIRASMPVLPAGRPGNIRIEKTTQNNIDYLLVKVSNGTDTVSSGYKMYVYRTNLL